MPVQVASPVRIVSRPRRPVYADEALKEEPMGFLYMNEVSRLLLETMQQMFFLFCLVLFK